MRALHLAVCALSILIPTTSNEVADTAACESSSTTNVVTDISSFLNYDISDLSSNETQTLIRNAINSLNTNHIFSIPNFMTSEAVHLFLDNILSPSTKKSHSIKLQTSWQDAGDYEHFASPDHARNFLLWSEQIFISKTELQSMASPVLDLYRYEPLLLFLKQIVKNADMDYRDLYTSKDEAGSVYGLYFEQDWHGHWHLDEHPFSCVYLLQRALYGSGSFAYIEMPSFMQARERASEVDYDLLWNIYHNDSKSWHESVNYHLANPGDVYCFNGNLTFHTVTPVVGPVPRVAVVMAYSEVANFQHNPNIHEYNIWAD